MNGAKVTFEDWHVWVQMIAFFIIFTAFVFFTIRTLLMKKEKENRLAAMALDPEDQSNDGTEAPSSKNRP